MLSGCEEIGQAADAARHADPANRFGEIMWTADPGDPQGLTHTVRLEAKTEATWVDAMGAIGVEGYPCQRGGGSFAVLGMTPTLSGEPEGAGSLLHPAGTVFEQRIECIVSFPDEISIEPGLSTEEGLARVRAELVGEDELDWNRHATAPVHFNAMQRKYPALHAALGYQLASAHSGCGGFGVTFTKLVVMSPALPDGSSPEEGTAWLGVEWECLAPPAGEASP